MNAHNTIEATGTCRTRKIWLPTAIVVRDKDGGVETSTSAKTAGKPGVDLMVKKTNLAAIAKVVSKTSMNGATNVIKYDILKGQPTRLAGGLTINHTTGTYQKNSGKTKI